MQIVSRVVNPSKTERADVKRVSIRAERMFQMITPTSLIKLNLPK